MCDTQFLRYDSNLKVIVIYSSFCDIKGISYPSRFEIHRKLQCKTGLWSSSCISMILTFLLVFKSMIVDKCHFQPPMEWKTCWVFCCSVLLISSKLFFALCTLSVWNSCVGWLQLTRISWRMTATHEISCNTWGNARRSFIARVPCRWPDKFPEVTKLMNQCWKSRLTVTSTRWVVHWLCKYVVKV